MGAKKSQEIYNYVDLKVTSVHLVKVKEHDESEWNRRSRSFSGLPRRVNNFVVSLISYIIHLMQTYLMHKISYSRNVQCDDMWRKDLCIGRVGA